MIINYLGGESIKIQFGDTILAFNPVSKESSLKTSKYGADIVRLWVSSVDWQNEVPFGEDLFKQIAEPYRRLRNTLRWVLGKEYDSDTAQQFIELHIADA